MFCAKCGNNLADGAKFCGACGTVVEAQPPAPPPAAMPYQQPLYAQPVQTPPPVYAPSPAYAPPMQMAPLGYAPPLSMGQYLVTFLLMGIPLLNVILLFVWGFGSSTNPNKKNLARAILLMSVIGFAIWAIVGGLGIFSGVLSGVLEGMGSY